MDSKSLDKALDSILNILPRTVAPLEAITYSVKKKLSKNLTKKKNQKFFFREIATSTSRLLLFHNFFPNVMNLSATLLRRSKKNRK